MDSNEATHVLSRFFVKYVRRSLSEPGADDHSVARHALTLTTLDELREIREAIDVRSHDTRAGLNRKDADKILARIDAELARRTVSQ